MSEVLVHECADGQRFRINKVQEIREQPLVQGIRYAFQVDAEVEEGAPTAEAGGTGSFDVTVTFAPIFVSIATPQARQDLDVRALELVSLLLDKGHRQQAELRITSDGAAKLDDTVVDRLYPLA